MPRAPQSRALPLRRADPADYTLLAAAAAFCAIAASVPATVPLAGAFNLISGLAATSATVALLGFLLPLTDCLRGR